MPDLKISASADAGPLDGTEMIPLARASSTAALHTDPTRILNIGTITTANGAPGTDDNGVNVSLTAGHGDGTGNGGGIYLVASPSGYTSGYGGGLHLSAGAAIGASGDGGTVLMQAGNASAGYGGNFGLQAGIGVTPDKNGRFTINGSPALLLAQFAWTPGLGLTNRTIFTATRALRVIAIMGRVDVANGGAATFTVSKAPSGTAYSAGTLLHTGSFNLAGTANANQTLTLSATPTDLLLAAGDSIGIIETGALGTAVGALTVHLGWH